MCTLLPVYKHPVFQQSSPKLDLINNINVLESSPSASPFPHLLHKPLRVISSNTRDFYLFKYSPQDHLLVQVILSRPIEALTMNPPLVHVIVLNYAYMYYILGNEKFLQRLLVQWGMRHDIHMCAYVHIPTCILVYLMVCCDVLSGGWAFTMLCCLVRDYTC